jgi:hypothetical protein
MATVVITSIRADLDNPLTVLIVPLTKPKVDTNRLVWSHEWYETLTAGSVSASMAAGLYEIHAGMSKAVINVPAGDATYNWHDLLVNGDAFTLDLGPLITQKRFFEVATVAAMRLISYSIYNWECRLTDETMVGEYRWETTGTDADDGYNVIRPATYATYSQGIWRRWI